MKSRIHVCFFAISLLLIAVGCGRQPNSTESDLSSTPYSQTGMASYYGVGDATHLTAVAIDGQGRSMGQSEDKELRMSGAL